MPVLPDVGSTITLLPGSIRPAASAASTIDSPIRSLTLPAGFRDSIFPRTVAPVPSPALSRSSGVRPTRSVIDSAIGTGAHYHRARRLQISGGGAPGSRRSASPGRAARHPSAGLRAGLDRPLAGDPAQDGADA